MDVSITPSSSLYLKWKQVLTKIPAGFLFILLVNVNAVAQSPLGACADQFIDGEMNNSSTLYSSP